MSTQTSKSSVKDTIRLYLFPGLVAILGSLIWRDINEMRSDVKMLLAQSNIDKTRIENLERDVRQLEQVVFHKKAISQTHFPLFMRLYFKPEEQYDVKKYIPKQV